MVSHSPDPSMGLFETLLIAEEQPVALDEHLARLGASVAAVYGGELPESARDLASQTARGLELGRLRLTAVPAGGVVDRTGARSQRHGPLRLDLDAEAAPLDPELLMPSLDHGTQLSSFELPGGLGAHKWRDRSVLPDETEALPLILDREGELLEASRANVFAVHQGALFTPPLDGRILAGTTRALVLSIAGEVGIEATERRLRQEELWDSEEVFLTGSVRGVEPARTLDGVELGRGEVTALLAERLAARWGLPARARQP